MRPQDTIAKKRDGIELSDQEIRSFIDGVCDGSWADYQITAIVMAMVIRGLTEREQDSITEAMLHSGNVLDLSGISRPKGDKHSTGGVGDKTSLVIAPVVAACGVAVPMISGRGLGHTGGTLDKLEAIPGYDVSLTVEGFYSIIDKCGFAMTGQTDDIAPADKKLYALRDATATVPCIPLIVASIMSKKLAEGLDALVLDVKTGSGAFMQRFEDSHALAEALVRTGRRFSVKTEAVISDMSQPLGRFVGNAVETYECLKILRGEADPAMGPTTELSLELAARLLVLARAQSDLAAARQMVRTKLENGEASDAFRKNVELQGGDPRVCDDPGLLLDQEIVKAEVRADASGIAIEIDTLAIGNAVCGLGGGRTMAGDPIDHAVGYENCVMIGDEVREGEPLGVVYCRSAQQAESVVDGLRRAYSLGDEAVDPPDLVREVVA